MATVYHPSLKGRTPESASSGLRRKDSRHIVDTCHGTTSNGSPCRRRLPSKNAVLRSMYARKGRIILPMDQDAMIFVCWQHEQQATELAAQYSCMRVSESQSRKSLESVFEDLDLDDDECSDGSSLDIPADGYHIGMHYGQQQGQPRPSSGALLSQAYRIDMDKNSLQAVNSEKLKALPPISRKRTPVQTYREKPKHSRPSTRRTPDSFWRSLFGCVAASDNESPPAALYTRRRRRNSACDRRSVSVVEISVKSDHFAGPTAGNVTRVESRSGMADEAVRDYYGPQYYLEPTSNHITKGTTTADIRSSSHVDRIRTTRRQSDTSSHPCYKKHPRDVHYTPVVHVRHQSQPNLSVRAGQQHPVVVTIDNWTPSLPITADDDARLVYAKLLTIMSQPLTALDGEGYIYMFWQTELSTTEAETNAAVSLVSKTDDKVMQAHDEEILQRRFFQTSANATMPASSRRMVALKIGMAKNVHQRILQWQKQCGYNITLLKYYPQSQASQETMCKVVCVKKVERLVHLHLEMLGYRARKQCRCGTEHREWFEIPGNANAVREVDSIIRHWIAWGKERHGSR